MIIMWIKRAEWLSLCRYVDSLGVVYSDTLLDLKHRITTMALDLSKIQAAVQRQTTVDASVLTLVNEMAAQLKDLAGQVAAGAPPAAIQAQLDAAAQTLNDQADQLSAAVTQNTPAAQPAPAPSAGGTVSGTGGPAAPPSEPVSSGAATDTTSSQATDKPTSGRHR